jgi:hypothetical protein
MPSPQKATIKGGSAAGAGHIAIGKAVIFPLGAPAAALASRGLIMARIKLKHVNSFSDRYGKVRHYFRRRGCKDVMLPGQPGSAEFMDAYAAALSNAAPIVIGAKRVAAGTVAATVGLSQFDRLR